MIGRGDGMLRLAVINVGQGDGIIACLPNGKTLMVDGGSTRELPLMTNRELFPPNILVNNSNYIDFDNNQTLDVLILTHPDQDHYNNIDRTLAAELTIAKVYHSARLSDYSAASLSEKIANNLYELAAVDRDGKMRVDANKVRELTLNATGCKINNKIVPQGDGIELRDKLGRLLILDGTNTTAGSMKDCKVWLLASNVPSFSNAENEAKNAGSIVTMIEFGVSRILLTGDARPETAAFLKKQYGDVLVAPSLMQMPHHGSGSSGFTKEFVDWIKPSRTVISAPNGGSRSFHLPALEHLNWYATHADISPDGGHIVPCWEKLDEDSESVDTTDEVFATDTLPNKRRDRAPEEEFVEGAQRRQKRIKRTLDAVWQEATLQTSKDIWSTGTLSAELEKSGPPEEPSALFYNFDGEGGVT